MEQPWTIPDDGQGLADALTVARGELLVREARELLLVAAWCDAHDEDTVAGAGSGRVLPGTERAKAYGGHGTPTVAEFAAAELALLLGRSTLAAVNLIRDALDIRERHPALWAQLAATAHVDPTVIAAGRLEGVQVWQARKVAQACHTAGLTRAQARWVDEQTTPYLPTMSWGGFLDLVDAKIIEADPAAADERRRAEEMRRFVATGQCNAHGLKTLIIKARAGDVICLVALIDRIARILALEGDTTPLDVRRSTAAGIIANPYRTIALLEKHGTPAGAAGDEAPHDEPEPEPADGAQPNGDSGPAPGWPAVEDEGVLDLFGDRRIHPDEPVVEPPPPAPPLGADQDPPEEPAQLGPGDLHPSADDSDDEAQPGASCPACGRAASGAPREESALIRSRTVDFAKLLPKATLVVHVSAASLTGDRSGVARVEGVGPVTVPQAVEFLGHHRVTVKSVIDLAGQVSVDCYEIPDRLREAVRLAHPRSIFPYSATASTVADLDHIDAYQFGDADDDEPTAGGHEPPTGPADPPAGQTSFENLAPLGRFEHRVKTHGRGWAVFQPEPGVYLWRTPHRYWFRVDHRGTHRLGKHPDLTIHAYGPGSAAGNAPTPTPDPDSPLEKAFGALIAG